MTVHDLTDRFLAAEAAGDTAVLDALSTADFQAVGPVGFVLDKPAWLRRFAEGLRYDALSLDDVAVRDHGDVAVAIGLVTQSASYRGNTMRGRFRLTLVAVRTATAWQLLGTHLSGPVPALPPTPGGPAAGTSS